MIRPIAMYLPQFHPIPENDEWWGKGFTEWTNVTKAKPLYKGHHQPHLPADLGFYDLRLDEARQAQADMAKEYGIYGFCYYHYWFNGRRILERPFQEVFESGKPDFPFMLCWANENWTRTWDGSDKEILLKQNYSTEDDINHIRSLIPYFKDNRYIKVNGNPVFAIYRSTLFPDIKKTISIWREEAAKEGLELYLCRFDNFGGLGEHYLKDGFDASVDFQPFGHYMADYRKKAEKDYKKNIAKRVINKFKRSFYKAKNYKRYRELANLDNSLDYNDYVDFVKKAPRPNYKCFPGITPSWDNSARKKEGVLIFKDASPKKYGEWLKHIAETYPEYEKEENFVFINAWNEWAEGNHLEPDRKWGRQYLEITKQIVDNSNAK
ncbi:MAG: glycoside hydrolase family 99-like domain-containing protein [Niabella sp.]